MEAAGLRVVVPDVPSLTPERVYRLAEHADVIFGPGVGLDAELFGHASRLKTVSLASTGYDRVDLRAATAAGVTVTNAPTPLMSAAVAEITIGLILGMARSIPQNYHELVAHGRANRPMGVLIAGKTIGIVGLGRIGRAVAERSRALGMRVLAFTSDRSWDAAFTSRHAVRWCALDALLRTSDFVSLHLPATPDTIGLIGKQELALMKPNAYLINTARTALADRDALHAALAGERIAGLGSDVIADDDPDTEMLRLPNVVGLMHLGNRCVEAVFEVMETAIDNALTVLRGGRPAHLLNPEALHPERRANTHARPRRS